MYYITCHCSAQTNDVTESDAKIYKGDWNSQWQAVHGKHQVFELQLVKVIIN